MTSGRLPRADRKRWKDAQLKSRSFDDESHAVCFDDWLGSALAHQTTTLSINLEPLWQGQREEEHKMVAKIASASSSSLLRNRRRTIPSFQLALVLVLLLSLYLDQVSGVYHPPNSPRKREAQDLKVMFSNFHDLMFCRDCDDPLQEGSVVLVFAIPNDGSFALYNAHELTGKIAVFTRGKVSVVRKAQIAQNAGALAAVVIDSDTCDPETMHCHRSVGVSPDGATLNELGAGGGDEKLGLGMFHGDPESQWLKVRIPVAMLSAADGARIRSFMDLVTVEVNGELNYLVGV